MPREKDKWKRKEDKRNYFPLQERNSGGGSDSYNRYLLPAGRNISSGHPLFGINYLAALQGWKHSIPNSIYPLALKWVVLGLITDAWGSPKEELLKKLSNFCHHSNIRMKGPTLNLIPCYILLRSCSSDWSGENFAYFLVVVGLLFHIQSCSIWSWQ